MSCRARKKRKRKNDTSEGRGPAARLAADVHPPEIPVPSLAEPGFVPSRGRRRIAGVALCLLVLCVLHLAFGTGCGLAKEKKALPRAVMGRVLNEADDGLAGAVVELTDLKTGRKVAIVAEEGGRYQFSDLELTHDYEVKATYKGASSDTRKASALGERRVVLNLKIPKS